MIIGIAFIRIARIGARFADLITRLMALGPFGLFCICLLDSAFVPLPSGPDLVMITLAAVRPGMMLPYALAATIGSTIGCTFLYMVARRGGAKVLSKVSPVRRDRIENLLGRYDILAVMVPALLPPPFPFKLFVLSAGVLRLRSGRFVIAIFTGRAVRFLVEGWLAVEFGEEAWKIIARHSWKVLGAAAVVLLVSVILWMHKYYVLRSGRLDSGEIKPTLEDL